MWLSRLLLCILSQPWHRLLALCPLKSKATSPAGDGQSRGRDTERMVLAWLDPWTPSLLSFSPACQMGLCSVRMVICCPCRGLSLQHDTAGVLSPYCHKWVCLFEWMEPGMQLYLCMRVCAFVSAYPDQLYRHTPFVRALVA